MLLDGVVFKRKSNDSIQTCSIICFLQKFLRIYREMILIGWYVFETFFKSCESEKCSLLLSLVSCARQLLFFVVYRSSFLCSMCSYIYFYPSMFSFFESCCRFFALFLQSISLERHFCSKYAVNEGKGIRKYHKRAGG